MDRSGDGGMAPALQSSNHQSTSLVSQEVEATRVNGGVISHKKVNGNAYEDDVMCKNPLTDSDSSMPVADAAGDTGSEKIACTESTVNVTESCILTGLKEVLPEVSMPAIHLGQGDATVTTNHNGWGDCLRLHATGVLQETNNISDVHATSKGLNKTALYVEKTSSTKDTSYKNENQPNGKIRTAFRSGDSEQSLSPMLEPGAETAALVSQAVTSTGSNTVNTTSLNSGPTGRNPPSELADKLRIASNGGSRDGEKCADALCVVNNETVSQPRPELGKTLAHEAILPQALNYAELLNSDLSMINMSDKLANTLQELAASLKGTPMSLDMETTADQRGDSGLNHTVNSCRQESLHRSAKSLDFSTGESTEKENVVKEQKRRIDEKAKAAAEGAGILDYRLHVLKRNIDTLRCRRVKLHVKKELGEITSQESSSRTSKNWGRSHMNVDDVTKAVDLSSEFWRRLFENRLPQTEKQFSDQFEMSFKKRKLSEDVMKANNIDRLNSEITNSDQTVPANANDINMDPFVQLTRVENVITYSNNKEKLLQQAKVNAGVLRKELKYVSSRCDPDLTESSSDEDVTETVPEKLHRSKLLSKSHTKPTNRKFRKSFCKWVAERAEIARKWTWLQSRISSLEFSIRQQGELYARLRDGKGIVQLGVGDPDCGSRTGAATSREETSSGQRVPHDGALLTPASVSTSPCNVNLLVDNVHNQTSKLFDKLSPLSGGSPSPNQPATKTTSQSMSRSIISSGSISTPSLTPNSGDKLETCARTRQLCLSTFQNRRLVKLTPSSLASSQTLKSKTVPNDSSIMCVGQNRVCKHNGVEGQSSLILKAALHDHSYHAVISSTNDLPLSISMRAVMKSKRKWCKKHGTSEKSSPPKKELKQSKKHKHKKKSKHKSQKKNKRSFSTITPNHLDDVSEGKRRKISESARKTHRGASFDSDLDSPVVIGGFNSHQPSSSGATTPTSEIAGQNQNYWKKKKSSEQAYDINNIVIPHGLNSARIEKLAYKEIQTPSWKILELDSVKEEKGEIPADDQILASEVENTTCAAFQVRHDAYEIVEKRKYMAFMEWSILRKGSRGSRMSNIRGPSTPEPVSPPSLNYTPSPMSFSSEPYSSNTMTVPVSSSSSTSPTAKPGGVTTRRMSTDHNPGRPCTPPSHLHQRNADTSLSHSYSSPVLAAWQDGFGLRRGSQDSAQSVNRTLSESGNGHRYDQTYPWTWETRTFPLSAEDLRSLDDVEYARQKLNEDRFRAGNLLQDEHYHVGHETGEGSKHNFVSRQSSGEKINPPTEYSRTFSQDSSHEHHHSKSGVFRRRRTDSRASSLASYDDTARHSDASNTSASSARRRRKKTRSGQLHFSHHKRDQSGGKGSMKAIESSRNPPLKHKYIHLRLSETDDSSSDSDTDSSDENTSTSYDDAGHVVDDFADPEWEAPIHRHRERK